jgi:hypothetical protein
VESRLVFARPGEDLGTETTAFFAPLEPYVPPNVPLAEVTENMTVVCHASPDTGWRILRDFLLGTQTRLTSTMYEFTARHVLDTLVEALQDDGKEMSLILDAGHQQLGSGDVSKDEVVNTLQGELSDRFRFAWAAVGDDSVTSVAFFRNAYHIKVSVRDGNSFWLSSGNWKRSGQPTIDPFNPPAGFDLAAFQRRSNREWHVVIHSPALAQLLETYITHDITQAEAVQVPQPNLVQPQPMPDVFIPDTSAAAFLASPQFFRELEVKKELTVQPLLTPDNFIDFVLPLIEGAQTKQFKPEVHAALPRVARQVPGQQRGGSHPRSRRFRCGKHTYDSAGTGLQHGLREAAKRQPQQGNSGGRKDSSRQPQLDRRWNHVQSRRQFDLQRPGHLELLRAAVST